MTKITFVDNNEPALSASNLNTMQNNIEAAITNATLTPQNTYNTSTSNVYSASFVNGTVLYSNDSGTDGTVQLSASVANYKRIVIQCFETRDNSYTSLEVYDPDNKHAMLYNVFEGASPYLFCGRISISGSQITWDYNNRVKLNEGTLSTDQYLKITKVVGYKY